MRGTFRITTTRKRTTGETIKQTLFWNGKNPIALGHPHHTVLEQNENGIHIREIPQTLNKTQSVKSLFIQHKNLLEMKPIKFSKVDVSLRFFNAEKSVSATPLSQKSKNWLNSAPKKEHWDDPETAKLFKSAGILTSAFIAALLVLNLIPQAEETEEELIPAEFAKVILESKTDNTQSAAVAGGGSQNNQATATTVKPTFIRFLCFSIFSGK